MGSALTVLLDSHVLHWWSAEPERLTRAASDTILGSDRLAVSAVTWLELAWLGNHERIIISVPLRDWLEGLASQVLTVTITPSIAASAVELPSTFPKDPADRLIFATALHHGLKIVTKDEAIRGYAGARDVAIW